jgi:hypothetical protein
VIPFAISKVTIYSLLLGVVLATGIGVWSSRQIDPCTRFLEGDKSQPATQLVESGTRRLRVPCNDWIARQPLWVQILCLLNAVLGVVFMLNLLSDLRAWLQVRRQMRGMR